MSCIAVLAVVLFAIAGPPAWAAPPAVDATVSPPVARIGAPVTFSATATADPDTMVLGYAWDFGDGVPTLDARASHVYDTPGRKSATLTVTDSNSESTVLTPGLDVVGLPNAAFTFAPSVASVGRTVSFDASGSDDPGGAIASYAWDFGDGGTGSGLRPDHVFTTGGATTVTLTTTAALDGRTTSVSRRLEVDRPPVADFTFAPAAPRVGAVVSLTSTAFDPDGAADLVASSWDLDGDGDFGDASGPGAQTTFSRAGPHTVGLRVVDAGGSSSEIVRTVDVVGSPSSAFSFTPAVPTVGQSVAFDGSASIDPGGAVGSYAWDFGDGSLGAGAAPSHVYTTGGAKTVTLTTTAALDGRTTSVSRALVVNRAPVAGFSFEPAAPRIGAAVTLTSTAGDPDGASDLAGISWDLDGNGSFGDATGATVRTTFATPGGHAVKQRVTDAEGATDTITRTVGVVGLPGSSFSSAPVVPTVGEGVAFDGSRSADPGGGIATYQWDFGDGDLASGATANHVYTSGGEKRVTLTTTAALDGRSTSISRTVVVDRPPVASFSFAPAAPGIAAEITLTSTASDPDGAGDIAGGLSWDLDGDGSFADVTTQSVKWTFATAGGHTIGLRVTDANGVTDTVLHTITVNGPPAAPAAAPPPAQASAAPVTTPFVAAPPAVAAPPIVVVKSTAPTPTPKAGLRALAGVRVQIAGTVTAGRTRITRFTVLTPANAQVVARCSGSGCPSKSVTARAPARGGVRLSALQRTLRAGARVVITVAKRGFVTRRIVLTVRRGRAPLRQEACLLPGEQAGTTTIGRCPAP